MSTLEADALLQGKDKNGNTIIAYPYTKAGYVLGAEGVTNTRIEDIERRVEEAALGGNPDNMELSDGRSVSEGIADAEQLARMAGEAADDALQLAQMANEAAGNALQLAQMANEAAGNVSQLAEAANTAADAASAAAQSALSGLAGKADASHAHSTTDITSGTLSVARGGTGLASYTANRLMYPSASTTISQLAFPSAAGSFLRQGTSGAPYFSSPSEVLSAIGAAASSHSHTASSVGAIATSGGTLSGALYAHSSTDYTTSRVRNIYATTSDLTAGSSSLTSGSICVVYE